MNDINPTYNTANKTCPYCQTKIKQGADSIICSDCGTPHHKECWEENEGCTTFGCLQNPVSKKNSHNTVDIGDRTVDEVREIISTPATPQITQTPGRNLNPLTNCPNCNSLIDENSTYCKLCGFNIVEGRAVVDKVQFEKEYRERYRDKTSLQRKRFFLTTFSILIIIALFVFIFYSLIKKYDDYIASPEHEVLSTIRSWETAWEDKNIDRYKDFLSKDYIYIYKDGKDDNEKRYNYNQRINRLEWTFRRYDYIRLDLSDVKVIPDKEDSAKVEVSFIEDYKSDKYEEEGKKILYLQKDNDSGNWIIYKEVFEL